MRRVGVDGIAPAVEARTAAPARWWAGAVPAATGSWWSSRPRWAPGSRTPRPLRSRGLAPGRRSSSRSAWTAAGFRSRPRADRTGATDRSIGSCVQVPAERYGRPRGQAMRRSDRGGHRHSRPHRDRAGSRARSRGGNRTAAARPARLPRRTERHRGRPAAAAARLQRTEASAGHPLARRAGRTAHPPACAPAVGRGCPLVRGRQQRRRDRRAAGDSVERGVRPGAGTAGRARGGGPGRVPAPDRDGHPRPQASGDRCGRGGPGGHRDARGRRPRSRRRPLDRRRDRGRRVDPDRRVGAGAPLGRSDRRRGPAARGARPGVHGRHLHRGRRAGGRVRDRDAHRVGPDRGAVPTGRRRAAARWSARSAASPG